MNKCNNIKLLIKKKFNQPEEKCDFNLIELHIAKCNDCKKYYDRLSALDRALQVQTPDLYEPSDNFKQTLHKKMSDVQIEKSSHIFDFSLILKPALYISFIFAILFSSVYFYKTSSDAVKEKLIAHSEVESGKPVTIELEYFAARIIKNVTFNVALDNGVSFDSEYAEINKIKKHSWTGTLKKGINKIPFTVKVKKNGLWDINTKADFEGHSHHHKIVLQATPEKIVISYFLLPKVKLSNDS